MFITLFTALAAASPDAASLQTDGLDFLSGACEAHRSAGWEGSCWSRMLTDGLDHSGQEKTGSLPPFLSDLPAGLRGCGVPEGDFVDFQIVASHDAFPWRVTFADAPDASRGCAADLISTLPLDHLFSPGETLVLTLRAGTDSTIDRPIEETQAGWCRVEKAGPTANLGVDDTTLFTLIASTLAGGVEGSTSQVSIGGMGDEDAAHIASLAACQDTDVELATASWRFQDGDFQGVTWSPAVPCQAGAEGAAREAVEAYLERVMHNTTPLTDGSRTICSVKVPLAW